MTAEDLIERLAAHRTLGSAPRAELAWLAAHGSLRELQAGDAIATKGVPLAGMWIVLSGCIAIFIDRGGGPRKELEWRAGDVSGILPYSRMAGAPGNTTAQEPTTILVIPREDLGALIEECHEVTSILVHVMLDRARTFNSADLRDEKMASLGRLSAGLHHELNNPVSAIERSASQLAGRIEDAERATQAFGAARLTDAQLAEIDAMRACLGVQERGVRSPIQQAEREESIADWLAAHGADVGIAETLADTAVTLEALDRIAAAVNPQALNVVLQWAAAGCAVRNLAAEIRDAAGRIVALVKAVKGFTHMDQASVAEAVDLMRGLDDTIAVLRAKARGKSATVAVVAEPGLPQVLGFAGELNQIWVNLIGNALDAIPPAGRVEVSAARDNGHVVVRVVDNGPGIPPEIRDLIFDPFFTTKAMGEGTGLGLKIVRQLVKHNGGDLALESQPGRTEFRVTLPVAEEAAAKR